MENPTFRLEGLVKSKDSFEDFEGPLALILQLLSKDKIEIKDVKISVILEQYLAYLEQMKVMDLEIASEFIVMASHLAYIKSKEVLKSDEEKSSELEELISSLEELKRRENYGRIKQALPFLTERSGIGSLIFVKPPEILKTASEYRYMHKAAELKAALISMLGREADARLSQNGIMMPTRLVYSVSEKSDEILIKLRGAGIIEVNTLFDEISDKSELVAAFMAVLDLCRNGSIAIIDEGDSIRISLCEDLE